MSQDFAVTGGPLVVVPDSALAAWHGVAAGFDPDDVDSWGDFGRACAIDGPVGTLPVGDAEALVLGEDPRPTTYDPRTRTFVRADRPPAAEPPEWTEAGAWFTDGPATLLDAAYAGAEAGDAALAVAVTAGLYRVEVATLGDGVLIRLRR